MKISNEYRAMNVMLHLKRPSYGSSGHKWADKIRHMRGASVLDYGCGKGTLAQALDFPITEYDPAVPGKTKKPDPHDCVVCTDVLEHVEPEYLDNVLSHIARLMKVSGLLVIATRPANKTLPDGRNAHLIVEPWEWWEQKLSEFFHIRTIDIDTTEEGEVAVWIEPKSESSSDTITKSQSRITS